MNQFKVSFKRTESFYTEVLVEATSHEEARAKADQMSLEGEIEYDYFKESNIIDEYIYEVEKLT